MFESIQTLLKSKPADSVYILSLSGGVDSMSMAVMLKKLRVRFAAVHIRHSSRNEDTEKELEWVRMVCHRLKIPLYFHHVLLSRPHATAGSHSDISRDEFEEYTRMIRFSMYSKAAKNFFTRLTHVLIGHHMDDVDENRIAELGKGNLIDIDGMNEDDNALGDRPIQLRPLCGTVRKWLIREFSKKFYIPHMMNSTPKWSKRGWIRDTLDSEIASGKGAWFLDMLSQLGSVSAAIDKLVNEVCEEWIRATAFSSTRTILVDTKSKNFALSESSRLDFDWLISQLSTRVLPAMKEMVLLSNSFGAEWNRTFKAFAASTEERRQMGCPIQEIRSYDFENHDDMLAIVLNRALQVTFGFIRVPLCVEKYVPKKSIVQLIELIRTGRNCLTWKINRVDVHMIRAGGCWYIVNPVVLGSIVAHQFGGALDAFRKCISSNPGRISVIDPS
jgi:tRNA(Ile)-lysidine synthase TilS/MesJ